MTDSASDDERAFDAYYIANHDWLLTVIQRKVPRLADAEDLCAEIFTAALSKRVFLGDYTIEQQRTWLHRTADQQIMKDQRRWARRRQRETVVVAGEPDSRPGPLDELLEQESNESSATRDNAIRETLAGLSTRSRQVLEWTAAGVKGPEIGARLDVTAQYARRLVMDARREFRSLWLADAPMGEATE